MTVTIMYTLILQDIRGWARSLTWICSIDVAGEARTDALLRADLGQEAKIMVATCGYLHPKRARFTPLLKAGRRVHETYQLPCRQMERRLCRAREIHSIAPSDSTASLKSYRGEWRPGFSPDFAAPSQR